MAGTLHPLRHKWLFRGDEVTMRDAKEITEFRRDEQCEYCARERHTRMDAILWEVISRRYTGENVPLEERAPSGSELAAEIAETTNLPELRTQIRAQARKGKGKR